MIFLMSPPLSCSAMPSAGAVWLLACTAGLASDLAHYLRRGEPAYVLLQTDTTTTRTLTSTTTSTGAIGRVTARAVLDSGAAGYGAVNIAYNPNRDEYLAVWVEDNGSSFGVFARILDAAGAPRTAATEVSRGGIDGDSRIGLAYGSNTFLLAYVEEDGDVTVRRVNTSTGKGKGKARVIGGAGFSPAVATDRVHKTFLVSYSNGDDESFLQLVSSKAKTIGGAVSLHGGAGDSNVYDVNHVATYSTDQFMLSVGVERRGAKQRPVGLGFYEELETEEGPFVYDYQFTSDQIHWVAAAFRQFGNGLVAWNTAGASSGTGYIRAIGPNGAPTAKARQVGSGQPVNVFPVAEDLDHQNLVIWVDLNSAALFGQEASDSAALIGSSFRISDAAENVESGFNAGAYSSVSGATAVVYTRGGASAAVVAALLSPP